MVITFLSAVCSLLAILLLQESGALTVRFERVTAAIFAVAIAYALTILEYGLWKGIFVFIALLSLAVLCLLLKKPCIKLYKNLTTKSLVIAKYLRH